MGVTHPSIILWIGKEWGIAAFLSLGERLVIRLSLDQVKASQSFLGCGFQVEPLWLPPFYYTQYTS